MKSVYESSPKSRSRSTKSGRSTRNDFNKENFRQPEQSGKRSQSKGYICLEKDLNTSIMQKAREGTISELIANIEKMEEKQETSLKALQLREAQEAKEKVIELKRELVLTHRKLLEENHQQEVEGLMESQVKEMSAFNQFWDQKIGEFEQEAYNIENEMIERHREEGMRVEEELRRVVPMKKKMSTNHLNYKRAFEALIKRKDYLEADKMKNLCNELDKEELTKAYQEKEQRIKFFLNQLEHRHKNELNVLHKRIGTGREELLKAKVMELEKLLHKFQNARHQLEVNFNQMLTKFEQTHKSSLSEESTTRSVSRGSSSRPRNSKMSLRLRSNSKLHISNSSVTSPSHNMFDGKRSPLLSPVVQVGKHKRSFTSIGQGINGMEISGISEIHNNSNIKTKRANSVLKQVSPMNSAN